MDASDCTEPYLAGTEPHLIEDVRSKRTEPTNHPTSPPTNQPTNQTLCEKLGLTEPKNRKSDSFSCAESPKICSCMENPKVLVCRKYEKNIRRVQKYGKSEMYIHTNHGGGWVWWCAEGAKGYCGPLGPLRVRRVVLGSFGPKKSFKIGIPTP